MCIQSLLRVQWIEVITYDFKRNIEHGTEKSHVARRNIAIEVSKWDRIALWTHTS